jgi:hypothetical protein
MSTPLQEKTISESRLEARQAQRQYVHEYQTNRFVDSVGRNVKAGNVVLHLAWQHRLRRRF